MKITTFTPQIMTKNAGEVMRVFEALGFEKRHQKNDIGELGVTGIQMQESGGFKLDISENSALPVDAAVCIRMNVDDFEAAYDLLISHGFRNFYGDHTADTPTSRNAVMIAPSGFMINLVKHIR